MYSLLLAKMFGVYLVVMALAIFRSKERLTQGAAAIIDNPGLCLLTGAFTTLLGCWLVFTHNIWVTSWPVIITLIAYLTLIKGIAYLLAPGLIANTANMLSGKKSIIAGLFSLILGLVLLYFGFKL